MDVLELYFEKLLQLSKVLASDVRLSIVFKLKEENLTSAQLQKKLDKSQSQISTHLNKLIDADIVQADIDGKSKIYSIRDRRIFSVLEKMKQFVDPKEREKADLLL